MYQTIFSVVIIQSIRTVRLYRNLNTVYPYQNVHLLHPKYTNLMEQMNHFLYIITHQLRPRSAVKHFVLHWGRVLRKCN